MNALIELIVASALAWLLASFADLCYNPDQKGSNHD